MVSQEIERTVPVDYHVDIQNGDFKGVGIIAIMQSPYIEVSGTVEFENEDEKLVYKEDPRVVIELYDAENPT